MSILKALRDTLVDGNTAANERIYPLRIPYDVEYPAIAVMVLNRLPQLTRAQASEDSLDRGELQLTLFGKRYEDVRLLESEVRPLLQDQSALDGAGGTVHFRVDATRDLPFEDGHDAHLRVMEIRAMHTRP